MRSGRAAVDVFDDFWVLGVAEVTVMRAYDFKFGPSLFGPCEELVEAVLGSTQEVVGE